MAETADIQMAATNTVAEETPQEQTNALPLSVELGRILKKISSNLSDGLGEDMEDSLDSIKDPQQLEYWRSTNL